MLLLLKNFQQHWLQKFAPFGKTKVLLAISGGADSVVLADLFYQSGIDFAMAHCNFQLRGIESNHDEALVKKLAQHYNKQLYCTAFDTENIAKQTKKGIEETARNLRYNWFTDILTQDATLKAIATAHHANDHIETLLIHFFRGTGITGLTGIPAQNNHIIRPLLFATKKDIIGYAQQRQLEWREDASNASNDYTRNSFRNTILPQIQKIFPEVESNLLANLRRLQDTKVLFDEMIALKKKKLMLQKGSSYFLPILLWKKEPALRTLLWEILKPYQFTAAQMSEVEKLFDAANSSYVNTATHRIFKHHKHLVLSKLTPEEDTCIVYIERNTRSVHFPQGTLRLRWQAYNGRIHSSHTLALLDADKINAPLILRKWAVGDYFYPLGLNKKKKISKFLTDNKLSLSDKEKVWVMEMNKKIIWIIGMRIDHRFCVSDKTKNVLQIEWKVTKQ